MSNCRIYRCRISLGHLVFLTANSTLAVLGLAILLLRVLAQCPSFLAFGPKHLDLVRFSLYLTSVVRELITVQITQNCLHLILLMWKAYHSNLVWWSCIPNLHLLIYVLLSLTLSRPFTRLIYYIKVLIFVVFLEPWHSNSCDHHFLGIFLKSSNNII